MNNQRTYTAEEIDLLVSTCSCYHLPEAYNAYDYFDENGRYLGPDQHGIEPSFDWGCVPSKYDPKFQLRLVLEKTYPRVEWDSCEITKLGDLDWSSDELDDGEDDLPVAIEAGWYAEDMGAEEYYPDAEDRDEAAQRFVDSGDWSVWDNCTTWVNVYTFRTGYALEADGSLATLIIGRDCATVAVDPEEPECVDGRQHDWQSPHSLLGGLRENPGVQGKGGGIVQTEVCANCGALMTTDTWAQNPETGEQGLTSVTYEEPTEETLEWVRSSEDNDA